MLSPVPDADVLVSHSQNAEDIRLWRVFKDVEGGFYVDIGAGHPSDGSVTRLFYDHGWSGLNVEPGPAFETLAVARPRDVTIRAAIAEEEGTAQFFVTYPDPGMSTLDLRAHAHIPGSVERVEEILVPTHRLDTLVRDNANGRVIHFLKVDVEGAERRVLASCDWIAHRPIVVVVEAVRSWTSIPTHDDWESILLEADYELASFDGINRFYVDRTHNELIPAIAYPVSALDRFVPASVRRAEIEASLLAARNAQLDDLLQSALDELDVLTRHDASKTKTINQLRADLAALYRSRTWQAGQAVARAGSPALDVARRLRRPRRRETQLTPQQAYKLATSEGQPWHFPRRRKAPNRSASPLDAVIRAVRRFESDRDEKVAHRLREEIERTRWADDESLRARLLSWDERQALVEADALVSLVSGAGTSRSHAAVGVTVAQPAVVVDVRCLQHEAYRARGVGLHGRMILEATREAARDSSVHLLTNAELPKLAEDIAALADHVIATPYPTRELDVHLFVQLSPLTASLGPATPFLTSEGCRTAAVVYDFIPAEYPAAYLTSPASTLANLVRTQALRHYDLLLPISESTAATCRQVQADTGRVAVTWVSSPLAGGTNPKSSGAEPFALMPAGGDARKNCAAAVAALATYRERASLPLRLVITGRLTNAQAQALREIARDLRLPDEAVELTGDIAPEELEELYHRATLAIVTSFAEGFSIPVAEAVAAGTPVVASDLPVHRELIGAGPWLGQPDDAESLAKSMISVLGQRERVVELQREALGDRADRDAVFERAVYALKQHVTGHRAHRARPARSARPRLALISPFPPQRSGVADYTAATFRQVARYADVDVYSSASLTTEGGLPVNPISAAPFLGDRYDAVVNVIGNSHFHFPMLDLMGCYGGACIAHDNRMVEAYGYDRGEEWLAQLLSRQRVVLAEELSDLLGDLDRLPSIGYDLIAPQATPLIVHGRSLARRVEAETGVDPVVLPFVPYNLPSVETIDQDLRDAARQTLGFTDSCVHVVSFGTVDRRTKGADLTVTGMSWLRNWGIPCHLHFVGDAPPAERGSLEKIASELGVEHDVTFHGRLPRTEFERFLLAGDVAVQIRTSAMLSLSGGLADCLAYGVPTVTTDDLAEELDAPSYTASVPAVTSSLLIAEALVTLQDRRQHQSAVESERREYLSRRSLDSYARSLLETLGFRTD